MVAVSSILLVSLWSENTNILRKYFRQNISFRDLNIERMPKRSISFQKPRKLCKSISSEKTKFNSSSNFRLEIFYLYNVFPSEKISIFSLRQSPDSSKNWKSNLLIPLQFQTHVSQYLEAYIHSSRIQVENSYL